MNEDDGADAAQPAARTRPMPMRTHSAAPRFDGEPKKLPRYVEDVRETCEAAGITDVARIIHYLAFYSAQSQEETFKNIGAAHRGSVDAYVEELFREFPGAGSEARYTRDDVTRCQKKYAEGEWWTRDEVGEYYREMKTVTTYLVAQNTMSEAERNKEFAAGFPDRMWAEMKPWLIASNPLVSINEGFPINTTREAAIRVVSGGYRSLGRDAGGALSGTSGGASTAWSVQSRAATAGSAVAVKAEPMDQIVLQVVRSLQNAGLVGGGGGGARAGYPAARPAYQPALRPAYDGGGPRASGGPRPPYQAGPTQSGPPQGQFPRADGGYGAPLGGYRPQGGNGPPAASSGGCNFCGRIGHFMANCGELQNYLTAGKLTRDERGYIVLSNGDRLPRRQDGLTMQQNNNRVLAAANGGGGGSGVTDGTGDGATDAGRTAPAATQFMEVETGQFGEGTGEANGRGNRGEQGEEW